SANIVNPPWKERCPKSQGGWMFPSPVTGRCYHASPIQQDSMRPDWTQAWSRRHRVAHVPPHLSLLARFGWHFDGRAAKADAARSDCDHHKRLWGRDEGIEGAGHKKRIQMVL